MNQAHHQVFGICLCICQISEINLKYKLIWEKKEAKYLGLHCLLNLCLSVFLSNGTLVSVHVGTVGKASHGGDMNLVRLS